MSRIVSSIAATNLAGEPIKRHSYLKSVIIAHVLGNDGLSMGDIIQHAYRVSPTTLFQSFERWSRNPLNAGFLGQAYESLDYTPDILTGSGGTSVIIQDGVFEAETGYAYPIQISAALEWTWLDSWYRPRAGWTWVHPTTANATFLAKRAAHNASVFYPWVGPPIWMHWAYRYFDQHAGFTPSARSAPWTATYNPTTDLITMDSPGNWHWTFHPGIDPNAQYLYGTKIDYPYKLGSGDTILESVAAAVSAGRTPSGYAPFVPVRMSNTSVSSACPELYTQAKKGFKKATGSKLEKLVTQINTNANIDEIDMAMLMFGVQANTLSKFGKRYIYAYVKDLWQRAGAPSGPIALRIGTDTPYPGGWGSQPGYALTFKAIHETTGTGVLNPVGKLWWEVAGEVATLCWQDTATTWRKLAMTTAIGQLTGLPGDGDAVGLWNVTGSSSEVGFVFPLYKPVLKSLGARVAAEVTSESAVLLVGSYSVIDTSSILAGIIFFVMVALIVAFPPGATTVGLLGSNAAVGTALGLAGSLAVLAGVIINMLAAIILTKIIQKAATLVLGDKLGSIVGAVLGFVAVNVGTALNNGMSMSQLWANMGSAQSLLQLTNAVGTGISGYIQAAMQDIQVQMQHLNETTEKTQSDITAAYIKNFGLDHALIDPLILLDSSNLSIENPSSFLSRTLMTGTDIAEMSHLMLNNFCKFTTSTDLVLS
jgi:hypothetical protein